MGTELYWFYDIFFIGIVFISAIKCYKIGFIASLAGLLAFIISLGASIAFSPGVSDMVYNTLIKSSVSEHLDESLKKAPNVFANFGDINTESIKINGKPPEEMDITFDQSGKTMLELKNVDLTKTGIENLDLSGIGFYLKDKRPESFKNLDLGKIIINESDAEKYSLNDLIFAKALIKIYGGDGVGIISDLSDALSEFADNFPFLENRASLNSDMLSHVLITLIHSDDGTLSSAVSDRVIKPMIIIPIRLIVFIVLFVLFMFIFNLFAKALRIINKIPLIGGLNSFLGLFAGLCEAALILFVTAVMLHIIIGVTGNSIVFINDATINNTALFKYVYNFNFLNLSGIK
ncbi:MAG: CvpA family protein [Eubacterium sp.]|jgi:predicted amino acid-binding ACT domain protein|nr:CvpA family protein [Eubacterium sp.]